MTNIKVLEEKNEKLQTEIKQINSKNKQLIENFKSKIWYHTMLSENDFLLRKLAKNWVTLGKVPKIEAGGKMDAPGYLPADFFSNIKFEDMLSDFGVRAAFLDDSLLKSVKEVSELEVKNKTLKEENEQLKEKLEKLEKLNYQAQIEVKK